MAPLDGKVVIVTGSGGGIGRAIAIHLSGLGARVVVNDLGVSVDGEGRSASPAHETVDLITAAGGEATAGGEDVANWGEAQRIVERGMDVYGRIDGLINNAAIIRPIRFQDTDPEIFARHQQINVQGYFNVARAVAPQFMRQQGGAYVHMTSSTALIGVRNNAAYVTSKAAAVGLSRAIALDMADCNVRSNCVAPAAASRMSPARADAEAENRFRERALPEKVAPLLAFLVSDAASDITGQIFGVKGNELYLYNQPRPIGTLLESDGWSLEKIIEQLGPAWRYSLTPLEETYHVFVGPPK